MYMSRTGVALLSLALLVPVFSSADQADVHFPYVGELTGDQVRIRAGGSRNYQILKVLPESAKLLVRDQKADWLKVRVPADVSLWISAKYVSVDPGSNVGTVTGDRVNVRARKGKGDVMGQVKSGDKLAVRGHDGNWLKIAPPETISAWVSAKYVRFLSTYDNMKATIESLDKFNDMMHQAKMKYELELEKKPEERDLESVLTMYDRIMSAAPNETAMAQVKAQIDIVAAIKRLNDSFIDSMQPYRGLPDKLAELEKKYQSLFEETAPPQYLATGWLNSLGKVAFRPASHKLVKGDTTAYLVRSAAIDLEEFRGKYVGIIGAVSDEKSWWGVPVIDASQIDLIYQKPRTARDN